MHAAQTWLQEGDVRLSALASRLSYESEAASSRAFERFIGVPSGPLGAAGHRPGRDVAAPSDPGGARPPDGRIGRQPPTRRRGGSR